MPNSPNNPDLSADSLRTYLAGVLPDSQVTVEPVDSTHQPLLLLQTKHLVAGFGFSNGNVRKSFDVSYSRFKSYFSERRGSWDALDLAFIFCVQPDVPDLDKFCSTVETDVYFCRKFVVPLAPPFGASLARLPFLPLTPLDGKALRPASAQTFLQRCGVPTVLARNIAVQNERGVERIVEDCLGGEYGQPQEPALATTAPVVQAESSSETVQLESVTIENFRAYRKPQSFKFGTDVTILYGPNGFGKTSFFDAIDFAITGGIGRLDLSNEAHFTKTAQHLDTGTEESNVSLFFHSGASVRKILRNVKTRNKPRLDGRVADRKTILGELTGREISAADRLDNIINLFRATHLFNQEQQELTKGFQTDCCLPADIVSRMLAFQDYTNAVNKTNKVRDALQSAVRSATNDIKELSDQIVDEQKELDRLRQTTKINLSVEMLNAEFDSLRGRLSAAGFEIPPQRPDAATMRGWRASIDARHGESQNRMARLSDLVKEIASMTKMRADVASLQEQILQKEQALRTNEELRGATELALQRAEKRSAEMNEKYSQAQLRTKLLDWVRNTKPAYLQSGKALRTLNAELEVLTDDVSKLRETVGKAALDLLSQENSGKQGTDKVKAKLEESAALRSLIESTPLFETNQTRLAAATETAEDHQKALDALRIEAKELASQITAARSDEAKLSRHIADVDKGQSELKALLSQLQGHIRSGECPLCGEDHGSQDELMRRIQSHLVADAASIARSELTTVREKLSKVVELDAANKQRQQAFTNQLSVMKSERAGLESQISRFVNSAAQLAIVIEQSDSSSPTQLKARLSQVQHEIDVLNEQVKDIAKATEETRNNLSNAKTLLASKEAEETNRREAIARNTEEVMRFQNDPRMAQISLDSDDEQLASEMRINLDNLSEFKAKAELAQAEVLQKKTEMTAIQQESASFKAQIQALRPQLAIFQRTMTQIMARLEESNLPATADEKMILELIAELSRVQAQLLALRDSTSTLELALDAVTTAAALTTLQQNIRNKQKAVETATQKLAQHRPWLAYFTKLDRLISSQQNEAIANFTREYGPRTSVIQRRLRSVYGFEDIEIRSHESTIRVRVKRHGEELRPIDYFSQSQQQTLLLGLFLTTCISQSWSGFAPVFMDDPVTHFDDLNTYAFLDLIVGLLESDFGKRQFIISTCDEKLLQLARQKFHHLGDGAVFYRFDAIGPDGPLVEQISIG